MIKLLIKSFLLLVFLCVSTNAFAQNEYRYRGNAEIRIYPNEPPLLYIFYFAETNNIEDMFSLGLFIGSWYGRGTGNIGYLYGSPRIVSRNNIDLSRSVRDKMRALSANISITMLDDASLIVNILLSNGTYTTIIYEPRI